MTTRKMLRIADLADAAQIDLAFEDIRKAQAKLRRIISLAYPRELRALKKARDAK